MSYEPEMQELIDQIDALVVQVATLRDGGENGQLFITGWLLQYEATSEKMQDEDITSDGVVMPDTQSRATSRGLAELASDNFTKR